MKENQYFQEIKFLYMFEFAWLMNTFKVFRKFDVWDMLVRSEDKFGITLKVKLSLCLTD
jgi:hypothetical protein